MKKPRTKYELRCVCRYHPLLGMWGMDTDGKPYVHIRVFKGGRLYTEVFTKHTIEITCRDCFRVQKIIIRSNDALLDKQAKPRTIVADDPQS